MGRRLTRRERTYRDIGKMMKTTEKMLYTLVTGKRRRKKTKVEKLFDLFKL